MEEGRAEYKAEQHQVDARINPVWANKAEVLQRIDQAGLIQAACQNAPPKLGRINIYWGIAARSRQR
jgi:hypothetical protein